MGVVQVVLHSQQSVYCLSSQLLACGVVLSGKATVLALDVCCSNVVLIMIRAEEEGGKSQCCFVGLMGAVHCNALAARC